MDRLKYILFIILFAAQVMQAQNLDSLFNEFVKYRTGFSAEKDVKPLSAEEDKSTPEYKCGFGITARVKSNYDKFSPSQQNILAKMLERPETDTSFVTPGGFFRIHFVSDTGSYSYPTYDLDSLAQALDYVYEYEINVLGYKAPPGDRGIGGDNLYDVYVQNTVDYGYTEFESTLSDDRYTSFMVINNDYKYFKTKGLAAAKVTAAHEFHHAIQLGSYIYREGDLFFHELTSTSMEEFVFDEVNDYYNYMKSYFSNPHQTLSDTRGGGYDLAVWNIFLKERFDIDIIRRMWELMPTTRAVKAIGLAIDERGSSIKKELNEFGVWTYFTNYRTKEGEYFDEAKFYPLVRPFMIVNYIPPSKNVSIDSFPLSNFFLLFTDNRSGEEDSLTVILTNADLLNAIDGEGKTLDITFTLSSESQEGSTNIFDKYFSKIQGSMTDYFSVSSIYNGQVAGEPQRNETDFAYPQPFSYSKHINLHIPLPENFEEEVSFNVYSISMDLVYSGNFNLPVFSNTIQWSGLDNNGERLATGVYIYAAKSGDEVSKGKIVIYNE